MDIAMLVEDHHLRLLSTIVQWYPIEEDNKEVVTLHHPLPRLLTDK